MPIPVLLDTDPGIDDAYALALILASPELDLRAVTTVFGNSDLATVTDNAGALLGALDAAQVELRRGKARALRIPARDAEYFHGNDGLGQTQAWLLTQLGRRGIDVPTARPGAPRRIVELAREYGSALTVFAVGPLTNIAAALALDPDAMRAIGRLIVMGGAVRVPGNVTAGAEFNFYADPHAADVVVRAGLPMTLIPLDVTQQVRCPRALVQAGLKGRRDLVATMLRRLADHALKRQPQGFALHDPLAVLAAIDPTLIRTERIPLQLLHGHPGSDGISLEDGRTFDRLSPEGTPTDVAFAVDASRAQALFAERVFGTASIADDRPLVVTAGGINMDLVVNTQALPRPGETITGGSLEHIPGGKGANQAVAARRAGAAVRMLGAVGADSYGDAMVNALSAEGIDVRSVGRTAAATGVALITVDRRAENHIVVAPGANFGVSPGQLAEDGNAMRGAAVLLTQFEFPMPAVLAVLKRARHLGVRTVLNPSPIRTLPRGLPRLVDVLVANELEAADFAGQPVHSVASATRALAPLIARGFGAVVITLGRDGAVWSDGNTAGRTAGHKVRAVDTTAAGDTFAGYLAASLAFGETLGKAVEHANLAAARSVQRAGAQPSIPYAADLS